MDTNFTFPRAAPAPANTQPPPSKSPPSKPSKPRTSNALRASVLDAALQLGIGTGDSQVAKWMFNEGVDEVDEDLDTPGLTSGASTAPSPNASDEPYLYPATTNGVHFSPESTHIPPIFPPSRPLNLHARRPSSDPSSYNQHLPELTPSVFSAKPRNKLVKKRSNGYLSEGEMKKSNQDLTKAEKKELQKTKARREKEERKEKKMAKKAAAGGDDTDGTESSKRSRSREAGYETDDGYHSAHSAGSKKSKSRFFKLGNKSKGEANRTDGNGLEPAIPPVPELPPIHPIADKFGLTLSFDTTDERSITPTLSSLLTSSDASIISSGSSITVQALPAANAHDSAPARNEVSAPPYLGSSSTVSSIHAPTCDPIVDSNEDGVQKTPSKKSTLPPNIRLPTQNTPFILRSPQVSPHPTPPPRLHSPLGRKGLPVSPRPLETPPLLHPNSGRRSPMPSQSPQGFDPLQPYINSDSSKSSVASRSVSPSNLHPGYKQNVPPPTLSDLASSEYIVPSPLPSPRVILSQHGLPPPSPPPSAPLPAPPTPGASSRPVFARSPVGLNTRVRSQRYDRPVLPRRTARSEEGHSTSPSAFVAPQVRRHQSDITAPAASDNSEADGDEDSLHSPVHDVLARYSRVDFEEPQEWDHALARSESLKRTSRVPPQQHQQYEPFKPTEASFSDDESVYPDEEEGAGDWDVSYYEESVDSHSCPPQDSHQPYKFAGPNLKEQGRKRYGEGLSLRPMRPKHPGVLAAGGPKPGWI